MSSIPLKVMIHGLIALAPHTVQTSDGSTNHFLTALLLDQRMPNTMMQCMAPHNPRLTFNVPEDTEIQCVNAGCDLTGLECDCTDVLLRKKISLEITPAPDLSASLPKGQAPLSEEPADANAGGDISYIANLALPPFNLTFDESSYQGPSPPQNLLARMEIPIRSVTACALAAREDKGDSHIQPFSFHPLSLRGTAMEASQAVAQMAVAQVDVPDAGGGTQQVTLHISNLDGTNDQTVVLDPGDDGYSITLGNDTAVLSRDDACDDGVGRHFALYYDLAMSPPQMADRLIPHARFTDGKPVGPFTLDVCALKVFNPMDRPVCPIAIYNP